MAIKRGLSNMKKPVYNAVHKTYLKWQLKNPHGKRVL
jgi:hypothetical protein